MYYAHARYYDKRFFFFSKRRRASEDGRHAKKSFFDSGRFVIGMRETTQAAIENKIFHADILVCVLLLFSQPRRQEQQEQPKRQRRQDFKIKNFSSFFDIVSCREVDKANKKEASCNHSNHFIVIRMEPKDSVLWKTTAKEFSYKSFLLSHNFNIFHRYSVATL